MRHHAATISAHYAN